MRCECYADASKAADLAGEAGIVSMASIARVPISMVTSINHSSQTFQVETNPNEKRTQICEGRKDE